MITEEFLNNLEYQWSGDIKLCNGQKISIWWTAWAMRKNKGFEILNVYSDLPKVKIN